MVQGGIGGALHARQGLVRIISACAGDGRDVIAVLAERGDRDRVSATLLEIHPAVADRARAAVAAAGLDRVQVQQVDAARSDAYADLAPAELVVLIGNFGNISPPPTCTPRSPPARSFAHQAPR